MPWHIVSNSGRCSKAKPYAVIQDNNSKLMGCHTTKAGAQKQIAALYANEGKSAMKPEKRIARPPADGVREAPFVLRSDPDDDNDGLTLDGYGAVFNRETIIDSYEGRFKEKIALGSMRKSFREAPPKVQFDHGRHPLIGSIPIARLQSISEDSDPMLAPDGGAHVIARLFDNWLVQPMREAIAAGAINGMSFRFSVVREGWETSDGKSLKGDELMAALRETWKEDVSDDDLPIRTLKELKVPEIGPVTWPAYEATSVSVRSQVIDLGRLHEPEQRKLLAQAVFIADTTEFQDDDAPQSTDTLSAGEHPSESDDAPQATQREHAAAGEHPSTPRGRRAIDVMVRRSRDVLLDIDRKARK